MFAQYLQYAGTTMFCKGTCDILAAGSPYRTRFNDFGERPFAINIII